MKVFLTEKYAKFAWEVIFKTYLKRMINVTAIPDIHDKKNGVHIDLTKFEVKNVTVPQFLPEYHWNTENSILVKVRKAYVPFYFIKIAYV